jgi:hypothetical protein
MSLLVPRQRRQAAVFTVARIVANDVAHARWHQFTNEASPVPTSCDALHRNHERRQPPCAKPQSAEAPARDWDV